MGLLDGVETIDEGALLRLAEPRVRGRHQAIGECFRLGHGGMHRLRELGDVFGRVAEHLHGVGTLDEVRDRVLDADGAQGQQMGAAAELAQHDDQLVGAGQGVVGKWLGLDAGVQREAGRVGGIVHGAGRVGERLHPGCVGQRRAAVLRGRLEVLVAGYSGSDNGPSGVPGVADHRRVEVAEGATDHGGIGVAEHAAATEDVVLHAA